MDSDQAAIIEMFLAESAEHLSRTEEALVGLEANPGDMALIEEIFRTAHTIKGNASVLGFQGLVDFAHALEDLLDLLRAGQTAVSPELVTLLLKSVDALKSMVPSAVKGQESLTAAHTTLLRSLRRARKRAAAAAPAAAASDAGAAQGTPNRRQEDFGGWNARTRTLRVGIERLDRLMNLTGEIAVARGRLKRALEDEGGSLADAADAHREADRLFLDLQDLVMKVRMVGVDPVFHQHVRTVRDLATANGKQARLLIESGDVDVDTTVVDHLRDPLVHMIRNAVDHGIESPQARSAAGKDPTATITLRAFHDAGSIVIQVVDDGAGLNRRRILERARSRGLIGESARPEGPDVDRLIFQPGFSTAESVTDISGRGVGMDVVRRNIEALRGSVEVESREGQGTTITIRLPLTLAIIEGFAVGVGSETYVIPLEAVVECLDLSGQEVRRSGDGVLNLRGKALPYLRLREHFGLHGTAPARESLVVVGGAGGTAGLAVDALLGESQAVIKPLSRALQRPGVSGCTILSNGRVALILDVPALRRVAIARRQDAALPEAIAENRRAGVVRRPALLAALLAASTWAAATSAETLKDALERRHAGGVEVSAVAPGSEATLKEVLARRHAGGGAAVGAAPGSEVTLKDALARRHAGGAEVRAVAPGSEVTLKEALARRHAGRAEVSGVASGSEIALKEALARRHAGGAEVSAAAPGNEVTREALARRHAGGAH